MIGKTLGHYEVIGLLGKGGMGEVYRAHDSTLEREVALKILPAAMAHDVERIARFEREARTLATLQHRNVASIYGFEEDSGQRFLVMELVEGEDLSERLKRGTIPLEDVIATAKQIAEGLEAAHERGIIHRDLKPSNIKIDRQGVVKILDFGLARAYAGDPNRQENIENSPTITAMMTRAGTILGTAAYMSPEQAKGKSVDLRSDIWSYGVILYEMLCGHQLFEGETVSETMAEVMKGGIDLDLLPDGTPRWLIRLLERCLDRDPSTRLQSIGEARIALSLRRTESDSKPLPAPVANRKSRTWMPLFALFVVVTAALLWFEFRRAARPDESLSFELTIPNPANLRQGGGLHVTISPDGSRVITLGEGSNVTMLYMRKLDEFEWKPIPGTEDPSLPTFSPDGKWIAFTLNRGIFKVNLNGGAPIQLLDFPGSIDGLSWSDDGYIYLVHSGEILRIPDTGGQKESIYQVKAGHVGSIGAPCVLPGSRAVLFDTGSEAMGLGQIHALDLKTGTVKDLGLSGSNPKFVPPGVLVYAQNGQVLAVQFDPKHLEVKSASVPAFDRVWIEEGSMNLDISRAGTVVYLPDLGDNRVTLQVVDRSGLSKNLVERSLPFRSVSDPRLSPDGTRLVVSANSLHIWMVDIPTETPTLLSDNGFYPVWSVDGSTVTYGSSRNQSYDLYRVPVDLSQPERLILDKDTNLRTAAMAPDGSLVFREEIPGKGMDLRVWPDEDPKTIAPLLEGPDDELAPAISPDGKWMAFVSDLSGNDEVYVCAFPKPTGRIQISSGGGTSPAWGKDGRQIFYIQRDAMIAATVTTESGVRVLSREQLFTGNYLQYRWHRQYDVMPDGKHFLMIRNPLRSNIEVVTNWFPKLKKALADAK